VLSADADGGCHTNAHPYQRACLYASLVLAGSGKPPLEAFRELSVSRVSANLCARPFFSVSVAEQEIVDTEEPGRKKPRQKECRAGKAID